MNKSKLKAAYTNKWLSRNRRFWHEENVNDHYIIIIEKEDAPKIVIERVKKINNNRCLNTFKNVNKHTTAFLNNTLKFQICRNKKKTPSENTTDIIEPVEEEVVDYEYMKTTTINSRFCFYKQ